MCGICGFVGKVEEKSAVLEKMMNRIIHRGPDDAGTYEKKEAALGFRRLSIIDLEHGHQPMFNENGDVVIVFNGEIYNHREVRRELEEKGHLFKNESDTECLIHAYEEYKEGMLSRLRGMFGFAIWDEKENTLFMARDFFGIKPLYYSVINGCLVFGSEIKSILEFPGYKKEVNPEALDQYLSYQYSVLPETFFKGIYKLMPGHYLKYKDGQIETYQYWNPMLHPEKKQKAGEIQGEMKRSLEESIKAHKISDVEVGSLLSSGVDSSYILANADVDKTFTVGFKEGHGQYSEIRQASELSAQLGCENYQKVITAKEYWGALPKIMYHMDEPLADPAAVALYFVDQLAAEHLKVVMSGEGSDELFGGYNIYHEPASLKPFKIFPAALKRWVKGKLKASHRNFKGKNYIIRGCTPLEKRFIGNARMMDQEEKRKILADGFPATDPAVLTEPFYEKTRGMDEVSRMQYIDLNFWLPGDILLKADKMSMAHSLETRVPFLDREVFRTASKLALSNKVNGKTTKAAFRQVAAEKLPESTFKKKKLGFPVPIRVWLKQPGYYEKVKEAFAGEDAGLFFKREALLKLLDEHYKGEKDNSRKIWEVYMFLLWYQVYFHDFEKYETK